MAKPKPTAAGNALKAAVRKARPKLSPEQLKVARDNMEAAREKRMASMQEAGLTDPQRRFVEEYARCYDKNKAYRAAYPDALHVMTVYVASNVLLKKPAIKKLIDQIDAERAARLNIDGQRVLEEIAKMAFVNLADFLTQDPDGNYYVDLRNATRDQLAGLGELIQTDRVLRTSKGEGGAELQERNYKIKITDKRGALELLAKHKRLLTDAPSGLGPDGKPITPPSLVVNFVTPPKQPDAPAALTSADKDTAPNE